MAALQAATSDVEVWPTPTREPARASCNTTLTHPQSQFRVDRPEARSTPMWTSTTSIQPSCNTPVLTMQSAEPTTPDHHSPARRSPEQG